MSFHLIYLLCSFLVFGAHGVSIQVFEHSNFSGLVWESNSTLGCTSLPRDMQKFVESIRTDTCCIVYFHRGCKSYWSEKFLPGDIILTEDQLGRSLPIESFRICNKEEGGNQLNVDITEHFGWDSNVFPDVLETYKNVCSCVNLPQFVQNMSEWSINNHHNDLLAYFGPDCSDTKWKTKIIKAGFNLDSCYMHTHEQTDWVTNTIYNIQSIGPDPTSAYFQISCNSSQVVPTETSNTFENTTESILGISAGTNNQTCQCQNWTNHFVELETRVNQLKMNQDKFQSEILQNFRNLIAQLKYDMNQLFA